MIVSIHCVLGDNMMVSDKDLAKNNNVKGSRINVTPLMAAYFLGYMLSEKGEKISDEKIEDLYKGACFSMGIDPVEDISELFNELFSPKKKIKEDLENSFYC